MHLFLQGGKPQVQIGSTSKQPTVDVTPEVFVLRKLLPQTADYDFNIHIMDFRPGEYLYVKVCWLSLTTLSLKTLLLYMLGLAFRCAGVGVTRSNHPAFWQFLPVWRQTHIFITKHTILCQVKAAIMWYSL